MKATIEIPEDLDRLVQGKSALPRWFGVLGTAAAGPVRHDLAALRESIARGIAQERKL